MKGNERSARGWADMRKGGEKNILKKGRGAARGMVERGAEG